MIASLPGYAAFSLSALLLKILILWIGRGELRAVNRWFLVFFGALFSINILELVGFLYPAGGRLALMFLTVYHLSVMAMGLSFLATALSVTGKLSWRVQQGLVVTIIALGALIVWPGAVIKGVVSLGYTSTRVPGPLYWVFQAFLLGTLACSVGALAFHARWSSSQLVRRKAKALLISISPIFVAVVTVLCLMQFGVRITGSVIGSCAILMFLAIFLITNNEHQLFKFLSYVPHTEEFKMIRALKHVVYNIDTVSLPEALSRFEAALITETLSRYDGNKTSAAAALGISRTSLRRKLLRE
ncbi:helix-turn-helix domain-containing protein [Gilvimarinus sp. F26214L]|uniref:helix-turn-helix domain-containing protein n=1 Tax=Gilvimarinus sp. DZF01 TaxID=3461371 RepID=UPI0040461225